MMNGEQKAVELFKKDILSLYSAMEGSNINYDALLEAIEALKDEATDLKEGIYAPDHFMSYTGGSFNFSKKEDKTL